MNKMTRRVLLLPANSAPEVHNLPRDALEDHASRLLGLPEDRLYWRETQSLWQGARSAAVLALFQDPSVAGRALLAPNQHLQHVRGPVCVLGYRDGYEHYDSHITHAAVLKALGLRYRLHKLDEHAWERLVKVKGHAGADLFPGLRGFDVEGHQRTRQELLQTVRNLPGRP